MRNNFKLCSILNFIIMVFFAIGIHINLISIFPVIILLLTGVYLNNLTIKTNLELKREKTVIILVAILLIFCNPLVSLILLLTVDKINLLDTNNYRGSPEKNNSQNVSKKNSSNILLELGIFMITLGGFIFFRTSYDSISGIYRCLLLLCLGILFLFLSQIIEKKYINNKSSIIYYVFGLVFIFIAYYSVGTYGILGEYLKIGGQGEALFISSCLFLISFLCYITYKKYTKNSALQLTYISLFLGMLLLLIYFKLNTGLFLLLINLSILILDNIKFKKNKNINIFINILVYIMFILTSICDMNFGYIVLNKFVILITILFMDNDKKISTSFNGILVGFIFSLIPSGIITNNNYSLAYTVTIVLNTILYLGLMFTKYLDNNKSFSKSFVIIINIVLILDTFSLMLDSSINNIYYLIVAVIALLSTTIVSNIYNKKLDNFERYLLPIKLIPLLYIITVIMIELPLSKFLMLTVLLFETFAYFSKNIKSKKLNTIFFFITYLLTLISNYINPNMLITIILLIESIIIPIYIYKSKTNFFKKLLIPTFICMLTIIYITFIDLDIFKISEVLSYLIVICIYILVIIITRKDDLTNVLTGYALVLPVYLLINNYIKDIDISNIFTTIIIFYVTYITCNKVIRNKKHANIFAAFISIMTLLPLLFSDSIITIIFTTMISIIILLIGFINEDYRSLITVGAVFIVMNVIFHLLGYVFILPFWSYLLIIGIVLIIINTYKEIKKK